MKSGNWQEREDKLLRHVGLYRLSLRYFIERFFFDGGNAGNVLQRLFKDGRLQARDGALKSRMRYYQLTLMEARRRSLPEERSGDFGTQAFSSHLAVLWFCCGASEQRRRLEDGELIRLFGDLPTGVAHCAEGGKNPCVWRIHVVGPHTKVSDLVRRLVARAGQPVESKPLQDWITGRKYGFAVLTESTVRCQAIDRALHRARLPETVRCCVEVVPSPLTLHEAIHEQTSAT